ALVQLRLYVGGGVLRRQLGRRRGGAGCRGVLGRLGHGEESTERRRVTGEPLRPACGRRRVERDLWTVAAGGARPRPGGQGRGTARRRRTSPRRARPDPATRRRTTGPGRRRARSRRTRAPRPGRATPKRPARSRTAVRRAPRRTPRRTSRRTRRKRRAPTTR